MFTGAGRRILSVWFPRFASDRALRICPVEGPFALSHRQGSADSLYCLNDRAGAAGLHEGMALAEARAFCPGLVLRPADPAADARMQEVLRRWSLRYAPRAGIEGRDGLVIDITGAAHLAGGEAALCDDMAARLARAGFAMRSGLADTPGAAWALAHYAPGIAPPGQGEAVLAPLPVAALHLDPAVVTGLQRLGLRRIGDLTGAARGPLARRFGQDLLDRLDRALGVLPDPIAPLPDPPCTAVRLTLPEPVGLVSDVMAGLERLLSRLCDRLRDQGLAARNLCLTLRRVDGAAVQVPLRLAVAMRNPARMLPLFARGVEEVDAGFGIDQMRLEAVLTEPMGARQIGLASTGAEDLTEMIACLAARIGQDKILRFQLVDSHIPERSFVMVPATDAPTGPKGAGIRAPRADRPVSLFPPEQVAAQGSAPPARFRWRKRRLTLVHATGPERIAPEWWREDQGRGIRDYWRVETREGPVLWMFHTPQDPGWFVQGTFA